MLQLQRIRINKMSDSEYFQFVQLASLLSNTALTGIYIFQLQAS